MMKILFVCQFGQSRSLYFAQRMQKLGKVALCCGVMRDSLININDQLLEWADLIVLLSDELEKQGEPTWLEYINCEAECHDKTVILNYIQDEPSQFPDEFTKFMEKYKHHWEDNEI